MQPEQTELHVHDSIGPRHCRAAGLGLGLFLLLWGPLAYWRWEDLPILGIPETVIMTALGAMLVLPWSKHPKLSHWIRYFFVLIALTIAFAFAQIFDTLFQYKLAMASLSKPLPVFFQSLMVFVALMQPPAMLFLRKPHLLK